VKLLAIAVLPGLVLAACGCLPRGTTLPPDRARLRLLGRWDTSGAPDRLLAVNPGSSLAFCYEGTSCVLHVDRSANKPPCPQLWVQLDGAWTKHLVDHDNLVVGQDAQPGPHTAWVVLKSADEHQPRWKPPLVASFTLTGVSAPSGKFLPPPPRKPLILEAIGDSITEGILVNKDGRDWPDRADSRATYAFQTALALDAEPRIVAFGRQGITVEGNGGVPPAGLSYPFIYDEVPASDPPAGIVVICHGGNDSRMPTIENGYRNLLRHVRARNPDAAIFCLIPFAQVHPRSIRLAVAGARADGDGNLYLVETKGWLNARTDTNDGAHPNAAGHTKAARKLTKFIRQTLGL
jgi:lysophospholipase L1-like esterase